MKHSAEHQLLQCCENNIVQGHLAIHLLGAVGSLMLVLWQMLSRIE